MTTPSPIVVPTDADIQRIAGMIYAESSSANVGGESPDEKTAIGQTIINRAYYAGWATDGHGHTCYNDAFGDGTILSAVKNGFAAYGKARWNEVMTNDLMKSADALASLDSGKREHLQLSIAAANALDPHSAPLKNAGLQQGILVTFNQAPDQPPSDRMEKAGAAGSHTFYKFKTGRECQ